MDAGNIVSLWMNIGVAHCPNPLLELIRPHLNVWLVVMTQYPMSIYKGFHSQNHSYLHSPLFKFPFESFPTLYWIWCSGLRSSCHTALSIAFPFSLFMVSVNLLSFGSTHVTIMSWLEFPLAPKNLTKSLILPVKWKCFISVSIS